jgi:hypothetical protein
MALIRYAEGQQRSGSLGSSVYSHNRFGQYIRARSIPVNPNTTRQSAARQALRDLTAAWSGTLTQAQRDQWTAYAAAIPWKNRLGDDTHLTGLAMYLRSNAAIRNAGLSDVDDGPAILTLPAGPTVLTATASEATQNLSVAFDNGEDWAGEDDAALLVHMGIPQGAGRTFFGGPYRYAGKVDGDSLSPPSSPADIAAPFVFQEGQRIWIKARVIRADGRLSDYVAYNFLGSA